MTTILKSVILVCFILLHHFWLPRYGSEGWSFEPYDPPLDPPLQQTLILKWLAISFVVLKLYCVVSVADSSETVVYWLD